MLESVTEKDRADRVGGGDDPRRPETHGLSSTLTYSNVICRLHCCAILSSPLHQQRHERDHQQLRQSGPRHHLAAMADSMLMITPPWGGVANRLLSLSQVIQSIGAVRAVSRVCTGQNEAVVASLGNDLERTAARIEIIDHRKDAQFSIRQLPSLQSAPLSLGALSSVSLRGRSAAPVPRHQLASSWGVAIALKSCTGGGSGAAISPRSIVKTICWIEVKR
jgi:hypothetical protein